MNYHNLFFFFHLSLQDIFEVCFIVSLAIFPEVYVDGGDSDGAHWLFADRFASIIFNKN